MHDSRETSDLDADFPVAEWPCVPVAQIDFAKDSYFAEEIITHLDLSAPWTIDSMLDFFETQCLIKDLLSSVAAPRKATVLHGIPNPKIASAKVTPEIRDDLAAMFRRQLANAEIRAAVKERYGLELSPQYVAVLRRRVVAA